MNKQDIAAVLAVKHGLPQKEADSFLSHVIDVLNDALKEEKLVKVKGLGTFKVTSVNARASVDVNTGERIVIEGREKISFTPETSMRDWVNRPFAQFETVAVNEGVNFDEIDAKYEAASDEIAESESEEQPLVDIDLKDEAEIVELASVSEAAGNSKDSQIDIPESPATAENPEISENSESSDDSDNSDNSDNSENSDDSDNSDNSENTDNSDNSENSDDSEPSPHQEIAVSSAPISSVAALVEVDDSPTETEIISNITNNPQTDDENMNTENNNVLDNEEKTLHEEANTQEQPIETLSAETSNDNAEEQPSSANEEPEQVENSDEDRDFDEYGYPTTKYEIRDLKWKLLRSNRLVHILSAALIALFLLSGAGAYMLFREMSKKDRRIDSLVAEVLDLSRKNTEVNEENAHMINVDDINLTAEQAAQLAEIRKQRRQEMQQRKKEIDDAYVKKMEDTRESVREQYRLREEQVNERMQRQKDKEKAEQEREAKAQAAKEKAAQEKAAKEKAVLEQLAREKAAKEKAAKEKAAQEKAAKEKAAREQAAKAAAQKQAQQQQAAKPTSANTSAYNQDSRVRLGAYNITGVAQTVTVRPGQTLASISKAYLGPGMECYVEAVNGGIKEVAAGQKVKIPSLQLKKKQ
jgi:nucleoid DNA-binding protein